MAIACSILISSSPITNSGPEEAPKALTKAGSSIYKGFTIKPCELSHGIK